jgi:uncharacterized protein (TIGR02099 family)
MKNSLDSLPEEPERQPISSHLKRWGRWAVGALLVFWLLVFVAWGALHTFIVPRIGDYREWLQTQASQAVGLQVRVASVRASGGWLVPWFEADQVSLLDAQGQEVLHLPRVQIALSPVGVLRGKLDQLVIDQPELEARRDAQGHVWVAGVDMSATGGDSTAAMDWLFSQPEWVVRQGRLTWIDDTHPKASPLVLTAIDSVMQNSWHSHGFELKLTPPSVLALPVTVKANFQQAWFTRAGDVNTWQGEVFADMPRLDIQAAREWLSLSHAQWTLQEGLGSLRLWADVDAGQWTGFVSDVALDTLQIQFDQQPTALRLKQISGRLGARWGDEGFEVSSQNLVFDTQEGEHWPGGELRLSWRDEAFQAGALHADRLDLKALAQVSQRLPISEPWQTRLARAQPQGQVNALKVSWHTVGAQENAKLNYAAHGTVKQLRWERDSTTDSPWSNVPGLEGVNMEFDLNQQGGKARVAVRQGSLTLPAGLDDPKLLLDQASGIVSWHLKDDGQVAVQVHQGRVANEDVAGDFSGSWHTGQGADRWLGMLDLTANLTRVKAHRVHRYLPSVLSAEVRHYVADAVKGGEGSQVKLRLRGNLKDMPFEDPSLGEFRVSAQVARGVYAYVPAGKAKPEDAWPALSEVNGELVFERNAMHFKGSTQLVGAPHVTWQKVQANISNLSQAVVQVSGEAKGPLAEVLTVVQKSAINSLIGKVLDKSRATGDADYTLALNLPLQALSRSQVKGSVKLAHNDLQIIPGTPVIYHAKGQLHFSEKGFDLSDMQGQLLGGDARLTGGLSFAQANGASPIQLKIDGEASAEGLRQAKELGFISRLAQQAKGRSRYVFELGLLGGEPQWSVQSDLEGMALSLPAPLSKPAASKVALRVESQLTPESLRSKSKVQQDQIKVAFGKQVSVIYVRDVSGLRTRVVRGAIAVGAAPETLARDGAVSLTLQLPFVDLDAWNDALGQTAGTSLVKNKSKLIGLEAAGDDAQDYLPNALSIKADQIKVSNRLVHKVAATGSRASDLWRFNVSADELNGAIEVRLPSGNTPAQLYARLAYLVIPPSMVEEVENLLSEEPSSIPALDIVVQELTLRNKKLGRLEVQAINRPGTQATREWRLNKFNATMPEATLTANGFWAAESKRARRTQLNFTLDIHNAGKLLARLGTPDVLKEGAGRLEGEVSWQGSPITPDYPSMVGKMNLNVEKGQFLKAEPGVARLMGVLNLQALPRRLTLDFDDVFSQGFAFDFVRGDVRIERGIANTNNFQMKGVSAGALIEGHADLAHETQDLKVVVVPEINAGTASLYMATINPLVGLTSYLAQNILSKPLVKANTMEFHVDGSWVNPRVVKVDP